MNQFSTVSLRHCNFGATPQVTTIDQFIGGVRINIVRQGIISVEENEIYNETHIFGKVAQRLSPYEITFSFKEKNNLVRRGVNLIQFINEGNTWKITSIVWDRDLIKLKILCNISRSKQSGLP